RFPGKCRPNQFKRCRFRSCRLSWLFGSFVLLDSCLRGNDGKAYAEKVRLVNPGMIPKTNSEIALVGVSLPSVQCKCGLCRKCFWQTIKNYDFAARNPKRLSSGGRPGNCRGAGS